MVRNMIVCILRTDDTDACGAGGRGSPPFLFTPPVTPPPGAKRMRLAAGSPIGLSSRSSRDIVAVASLDVEFRLLMASQDVEKVKAKARNGVLRALVAHGPKPVAESAHRLDQHMMTGWLQGLPEPADMHVHRALFDKGIIAPDLV